MFSSLGESGRRRVVPRGGLVLGLAILVLAALPLGWRGAAGRAQPPPDTCRIEGQVSCKDCHGASRVTVRIVSAKSGSVASQVVSLESRFVFDSVTRGTYSLEVVTADGTVRKRLPVVAPQRYPLHLFFETGRKPSLDAPGVASFDSLQRKPEKKALKEYERGLQRRDKGEVEAAAKHFLKSVEIDPGFTAGWNAYGATLLDEGRYKEAESAFRTALRHDANDDSSQVNLTNCLLQQNRFKEAETEARRALHLNAANPWAHYMVAAALMGQGKDLDEAMFYLKQIEDELMPALLAAARLEEIRNNTKASAEYLRRYLSHDGIAYREKITKWLTTLENADSTTNPPSKSFPNRPSGTGL